MSAWLLVQCLYLIAGGPLTPVLIGLLFAEGRAPCAFGAPVPSFVVAIGALALWPVPLRLIVEKRSE